MTDISVSLRPYHSGVRQGSVRRDALSLMDTLEALGVWTVSYPRMNRGLSGLPAERNSLTCPMV